MAYLKVDGVYPEKPSQPDRMEKHEPMVRDIGSVSSRQRPFLGPHPPASTASTDHISRKFLDVPYASVSPAQRLDIYLPDEDDGPFPVIVSIHGGAFMACDKADGQVMPMLEGLERDYAVVAVNYRLSGEAKFPAQVHDIKAAVRWIRANAERYGFDPRPYCRPGRLGRWLSCDDGRGICGSA